MSPFRAEQLEGNYNLDLNEFFYFQLHACALTTSVTYLVQQSLPLHTSIILTTQLFSSGPRTEKLQKKTNVSTIQPRGEIHLGSNFVFLVLYGTFTLKNSIGKNYDGGPWKISAKG